MSTVRGARCGAKEVVQLQPLARRLQLDDLEDDVRQADLEQYGKGTASRREDVRLKGIQIEIGATLQCAA